MPTFVSSQMYFRYIEIVCEDIIAVRLITNNPVALALGLSKLALVNFVPQNNCWARSFWSSYITFHLWLKPDKFPDINPKLKQWVIKSSMVRIFIKNIGFTTFSMTVMVKTQTMALTGIWIRDAGHGAHGDAGESPQPNVALIRGTRTNTPFYHSSH